MCSDFTKEVDKDNIAVITWNCLDKSMNTMTEDGLRNFQKLVMGGCSIVIPKMFFINQKNCLSK